MNEAQRVISNLVNHEVVGRLLDGVEAEVIRQDTAHGLFHGSWDWHSAVHGHWALLASGSLGATHGELHWVTQRLRSDALSAEVEHLLAHPEFELPYGRAWLLALMNTYERLTLDTSLRSTIEPIARSVYDWCTQTPLGPEAQEYQNPCWPLLHLWNWSRGEGHLRDSLETLIRQRFLVPPSSLQSDAERPGAFFSRWALQAHLIERTIGPHALASWLEERDVNPEQIQVITSFHSAHHLGTNATRAWGFWSAYCATGEPRWLTAYERHVRASLKLHETWADDREAYGHWVPQFTLYAMSLAAEDSPESCGGEPK